MGIRELGDWAIGGMYNIRMADSFTTLWSDERCKLVEKYLLQGIYRLSEGSADEIADLLMGRGKIHAG